MSVEGSILSSKAAGFGCRQHGGLARCDDLLRAAYRPGRITAHDLAHDEPVKELPQGGQILLDCGRRINPPKLLDVAGDMQGLDLGQGEGLRLAPVREAIGRRDVGQPGIGIADICPKELPKPLLPLPGVRKELRGASTRNAGRNRLTRRAAFRYVPMHARPPAIRQS